MKRAPRGWPAWLAAALCFGLAQAVSAASESAHQYVGAEKCKTCHGKELMGDQYSQWLEGPHHQAYRTLQQEPSQQLARKLGLTSPPQESAECLRCHVTAFGLPATRIVTELDPGNGVQCESCHGPGRDYRKKSIMSDIELAAEKGLWDGGGDASICTGCHNSDSPTFDPERYQLDDGSSSGFDFDLAKERIRHTIPEHVKGRYVELEKEQKRKQKEMEQAN